MIKAFAIMFMDHFTSYQIQYNKEPKKELHIERTYALVTKYIYVHMKMS